MLGREVAFRLRELLRQGCDAHGIKILEGSIQPDHVHMMLSCPTNLSPSEIMQYLKGRSSKMLQEEYPNLKFKPQSFVARLLGLWLFSMSYCDL